VKASHLSLISHPDGRCGLWIHGLNVRFWPNQYALRMPIRSAPISFIPSQTRCHGWPAPFKFMAAIYTVSYVANGIRRRFANSTCKQLHRSDSSRQPTQPCVF